MSSDEFTTEIARFMGSISTLLINIQKIMNELPDRRDNSDVKTQLVNLQNSFELLQHNLSSYFSSQTEESFASLKAFDQIGHHLL